MTIPTYVTPPVVRILMEERDYSRRAERIRTGGRIMERKELEQMTIKALRTEGEQRGVGFPSRTKKADLIDRIREQGQGRSERGGRGQGLEEGDQG